MNSSLYSNPSCLNNIISHDMFFSETFFITLYYSHNVKLGAMLSVLFLFVFQNVMRWANVYCPLMCELIVFYYYYCEVSLSNWERCYIN